MTNNLLETLHSTAKGFHKSGVMSDQTMREFDALCLPKIKLYSPDDIIKIRKKNRVSQSVFAAYLNITPSTIQKWEQGQKKPSNIALKLLHIADCHGLQGLV